jgi:hypothetical protein
LPSAQWGHTFGRRGMGVAVETVKTDRKSNYWTRSGSAQRKKTFP